MTITFKVDNTQFEHNFNRATLNVQLQPQHKLHAPTPQLNNPKEIY